MSAKGTVEVLRMFADTTLAPGVLEKLLDADGLIEVLVRDLAVYGATAVLLFQLGGRK